MIAFDLNGLAYVKNAKTLILPAEEPECRRAELFQWPDWAVRAVNALIAEGEKLEAAMRKVRRRLR